MRRLSIKSAVVGYGLAAKELGSIHGGASVEAGAEAGFGGRGGCAGSGDLPSAYGADVVGPWDGADAGSVLLLLRLAMVLKVLRSTWIGRGSPVPSYSFVVGTDGATVVPGGVPAGRCRSTVRMPRRQRWLRRLRSRCNVTLSAATTAMLFSKVRSTDGFQQAVCFEG